ncbi:MAG: VTT domain-containing protein, partial [Candidatus Bathyarchaeota archaeon]|nr:VTT domain-containing protein [Candidatus Bathyarchaeota archaeon]
EVSMELTKAGDYGYLGIFTVEAIANASIFLPIPSAILTMASGIFLNPIFVGIFAGLGAAVGELTGYLVGYGGSRLIEEKHEFAAMRKIYARYGLWSIFIFAAIPFPFDVIGIVCGILKVRPLLFFVLTAAGKITSRLLLATAGRQGADIFFGIFEGQIDFLGILIIIIITSIFLGALIFWRISVGQEKNNALLREDSQK